MRTWMILGLALAAVGCSDNDEPFGPTDPVPDPGEIIETQLQLGDMTFDARVAGPETGELVLLLHGFPETSYEWRHQLSALGEAGYRAVAPDQRGYSPGARPAEVSEYDLGLLVADVLAMADALGAERFHVVGHDWGAGVAWGLGIAAPERLHTLTAISVPHPDAFSAQLDDMSSCQYEASAYFDFLISPAAEGFLLADDAAQLRAVYEGLSEDTIEEYVSALGTEEAMGGALAWYRANIEDRNLKGGPAGDVTIPTMFIWSDGDVAICQEGADDTGQYISAPYRYEIIEGVNHWVPELAADQVTQLLLEQLTVTP